MFAVQINHIPILEFQTTPVSLVSMEIELTKFLYILCWADQPVEESSTSSKQIEDSAVSCGVLYTDAPLCCSDTQSCLLRKSVHFVMKTLDCRSFQHHSISQMSDFHSVNIKALTEYTGCQLTFRATLGSGCWVIRGQEWTGRTREEQKHVFFHFTFLNISKESSVFIQTWAIA